MKQLVIFDLDGTLVNTIADLAESVNYALRQSGFPTHPHSDYPLFVGNGIYKLIERALPPENRNENTIRTTKAFFMDYYMLHNTDRSSVYPGIDKLLHSLSAKGVALAVASNKVHEATVAMIHHFFPDLTFACVLGQRDGIPTKPDPAIVAEILHKTAAKPEQTLYVGDSGVDMQTAHNSGITAVAVTWGLRTVEELRDNAADIIINKPSELLNWL